MTRDGAMWVSERVEREARGWGQPLQLVSCSQQTAGAAWLAAVDTHLKKWQTHSKAWSLQKGERRNSPFLTRHTSPVIDGEGTKKNKNFGKEHRFAGDSPKKFWESSVLAPKFPVSPLKTWSWHLGLLKPYVRKNFSGGKTFQILSQSQRLWC